MNTTPPDPNALAVPVPEKPTLAQLCAMEDEELNDTLNDMLGIIECEQWAHLWGGNMMKNETCGHPNCRPIGYRPKYCSNANAVAEVRRGLTVEQQRYFGRRLRAIITPRTEHEYDVNFATIDASPRLQTIALILCKTH